MKHTQEEKQEFSKWFLNMLVKTGKRPVEVSEEIGNRPPTIYGWMSGHHMPTKLMRAVLNDYFNKLLKK